MGWPGAGEGGRGWGSVCAPARAHRVLDARRRGPAEAAVRGGAEARACPRSRSPTTATCSAPTTSADRPPSSASSRSSAPRRTSRPDTAPHGPDPGALGRRRRATTSPARGAYTHMTMLAARRRRAAQPLPRSASRASMEGYYYKPRMDRELLDQYAKGIIATTGCPSGEVADLAAARPVRRRPAQGGRRAPGHLRQGQLLRSRSMDHGLDIERRAIRTDLLQPRASELGTCRWWPPTTSTTPTPQDADAHEVLLCVSPARRWPTRSASSSTAASYYLKTADGDARAVRRSRCPRPATTRCRSPSACGDYSRGSPPRPDAALPGAGGETEGVVVRARRSSSGMADAVPATASPEVRRSRPSTSSTSSCRWASPATSSWSPTSSSYAQARRHPGRPRPRFGARAR